MLAHFRLFRGRALCVIALATLVFTLLPSSVTYASGKAYVRVNQVGYITGETKWAILMATGSESGASFSVVNAANGQHVFSAPIGASQGSWNSTYAHTYLLDFSAVQVSGTYTIRIDSPIAATSPTFKIGTGADLYSALLPNALFFYQAQQDGPNVNPAVMDRQPSHLADEHAYIYSTPDYKNDVLQGKLNRVGGPIDVSGGWFDAGDYLKFVETASYTDAVMLFAVRQYPSLGADKSAVGTINRPLQGGSADFNSEGKYGLDWLQKMWDNTNKILYYQVGIGDGNGSNILADHDFWRLPQADDQLDVKPGDPAYYVKYRPIFRVGPAGTLISPNLAGRLAADFGLCYQVYHDSDPAYAAQCLASGENIFDLAKTSHVGQLLTTAPYDYYPEVEWRDDMELGATELYFATALMRAEGIDTQADKSALAAINRALPHTDPMFYLQQAAHWAKQYMLSPNDGTDSLNLYDVSGLAHYELFHAIGQAGNLDNLEVTQGDLLNDLRKQLVNGTTQAAQDPFGLGIAYGGGDATPHALGYALEANFYDELAGVSTYSTFGLTERNWVLGENAWGSSFIVGAGDTFPHCMQHQVANLSGSLDGTPPIVLGATVDGPSATANFQGLGLQSGMRTCPPSDGDPFKVFSGKGARYVDNVEDWPSVEPADDYTSLSILVFAQQLFS